MLSVLGDAETLTQPREYSPRWGTTRGKRVRGVGHFHVSEIDLSPGKNMKELMRSGKRNVLRSRW